MKTKSKAKPKAKTLKLFKPRKGVPVRQHWTSKQKAKVLRLLDSPKHWCKHTMHAKGDKHCALGAIDRAGVPFSKHHFLGLYFPKKKNAVSARFYITGFNDKPETTFRQVRSRLQRIPTVQDLT